MRRQSSGPLDHEGHTNSALPHVKFVTPERTISRKIRLYRSVVAQKEDQGLVENVLSLQGLQHLPHAIVQRDDHRGVLFSVWIGDVCNPIHVDCRRLIIWRVHGIICQVEEKRLCRMVIDKGDCFPRESIGQIFRLSERCVPSKQGGIVVIRTRS